MKTIDLKTWVRQESYHFFKNYASPHFNIAASLDITRTFEYFNDHKLSKFNGMLWLISHAANAVPELKTRIRKADIVVEHDRVDPAFTLLSENNTLAFCTSIYSENAPTFFNRVDEDLERVKANPDMKDEPGKDNLLFVSCVPWVNFTSISHPMNNDETDCIPRISWGKFTKANNQMTMPVSLQVHHALADGYHAGLFFERLEVLLADPETIDWPT